MFGKPVVKKLLFRPFYRREYKTEDQKFVLYYCSECSIHPVSRLQTIKTDVATEERKNLDCRKWFEPALH